VHATDDKVYDIDAAASVSVASVNGKAFVTKAEFDLFKEQLLDDLCKAITTMKATPTAVTEEKGEDAVKDEKETLISRWKDNNLYEIFVGKFVTSEDIDNVVNTLTLVNALILTIPYGIMSSTGPDYWDYVEATLDACPATKFTFAQNYVVFSNSTNSVVYSTICCLIMALVYYLLRPKDNDKFRSWWKAARYAICVMMIGTATSVVSLIAISSWMFAWYIVPTSTYCTFTSTKSQVTGIVLIGACFILSMCCML